MMRYINVPDLLDVTPGTEIAWWIGFASFAADLAAVGRYPDEVRWQPIRHVADDDTHVIVTTDSGESTISKQSGVVVREPGGVASPLLTRVLDDVHNRRVSVTDSGVVILANDTQVEPPEHEAYITTIWMLWDTSWVMPELRTNPRGDYWLRLTTLGDLKRIAGVEAVTV